jgi:hypothetical protein
VISVLAIVGVLATYASGSLPSTSTTTPAGTFIWTYGFPLPWITTVGVSCFTPISSVVYYGVAYAPCLKSSTTNYDWISFLGDVLFYSAIGYGFVFAVRKTWHEAMEHAKKQAEQLRQSGVPNNEDEPSELEDESKSSDSGEDDGRH